MPVEVKPIVIDKDAFHGTSTKDLCAFAASHWLILAESLLYECVTDKEDIKLTLLSRFRDVILAGAYTCRGCVDIMMHEARVLQPYGSLADLDDTAAMRREFKCFPAIQRSPSIDETYKRALRGAGVFSRFIQDVSVSVRQEIHEVVRAEVKILREKRDRMRLWVEVADTQDIHRFAVERFLKNLTDSPGRFCLSRDWMSWQYCRLICTLSYEEVFLALGGGAVQPLRAEHDLNDVEYVVLLSRADAVVTRDQKLVQPLARAAFPEKGVFSSLEEVPESYRCDWANG